MEEKRKSKIYLWLSLPVAFYIFFVIVPFFISIYYSAFKWSGGPNMTYLGFGNYTRMFKDAKWIMAVTNNFKALLWGIIGMSFCSYIFALFCTSQFIRARKVYRFIMFIPVIMSGIVIGYIFSLILNEVPGLLNSMLRSLGLENMTALWLGDRKIAMNSISFIMVWQGIGLHLVVYMASMQNISTDVLEASIVDGCTGVKQALYITTPLMKGTIRVSIILAITSAMKMFEYVHVTTKGAPGGSSYVMTYYIYESAFARLMNLGYACTQAVASIVISLVLVLVVNFVFRKEVEL